METSELGAGRLVHDDPRIEASDKDRDIYRRRVAAYQERRDTVQVGDYALVPGGTYKRVCHLYDDGGVQLTRCGSWHLGEGGHLSFSGGLDPVIPQSSLRPTGETKDGDMWFFHNGEWCAENAVHGVMPLTVWRVDTTGFTERQMWGIE
ncbi:MAG: hypothetical protein LBI33_12825 [Propionibacteriaceae bacterium]|jgi:hypothetical protein|nr:hypothetical protein [Propionibacteriaceae bacterium]